MEADASGLLAPVKSEQPAGIWELACSHHWWSAACPGECLLQLSGQTEQGGLIAVARDTLYPDRKTSHWIVPAGGSEQAARWR